MDDAFGCSHIAAACSICSLWWRHRCMHVSFPRGRPNCIFLLSLIFTAPSILTLRFCRHSAVLYVNRSGRCRSGIRTLPPPPGHSVLLSNYDDDCNCILQTLFCSKSDAIKSAWTAFGNHVLWHVCSYYKCACSYLLYNIICISACLAASLANKDVHIPSHVSPPGHFFLHFYMVYDNPSLSPPPSAGLQ